MSSFEKAMEELGASWRKALTDTGNVMNSQLALAELIKGDRARAGKMIDHLPDDAIRPTMDAALALAGLLLLKGRARGLDIPDPLPGRALTQDPRPGA